MPSKPALIDDDSDSQKPVELSNLKERPIVYHKSRRTRNPILSQLDKTLICAQTDLPITQVVRRKNSKMTVAHSGIFQTCVGSV